MTAIALLLDIVGLSFTFNPKNHSSAGVFDNNGNATSYSPDTGRSFGLGYDAENEPASVTGGLNSITMAYRPDGLRAWKDVDGSKTYFLYDGNELVSELNSAGTRTCSYVSGPNGLAQARRYASPFYEDYIHDPQGSLIQFDREGDTGNASRFTDVYDAFGRLWWSQSFTGSQTFAHPADLGYIAQWGVYTDWETKPSGDKTPLPLMGVRYYDPYTGRFLARDPIGDGLNWYSYANGNPVSFMDPSGLKSTGTYLGDVGQVFVGYGNILNPVNAVRSGVQLCQVARKDGVKTAGKAAWQGVKSGYTTWLTTSDPTAFGESFGTVLTTAAAVAAPYAKAGVGAKVASAERLAATERTALKTAPHGKIVTVDTGREAANLSEQLTLAEAKAGAGEEIMRGTKWGDARFKGGQWIKKQHVHTLPGSKRKITVHYMENTVTKQRTHMKFKD